MTYKAALLCFPDDQGTGDGKIMKKRIGSALLSALVITVVGIVVFGIAYYCQVLRREGKDDLIPIEEITGINSQATLKPGCKVGTAYTMPYDDNGIWCHCFRIFDPAILQELNYAITGDYCELTEDPSQLISDIRIIDVYGDKCTITFTVTDGSERYRCWDYPLENLDYNINEVISADDGIKTTLLGSRFTLDRSSEISGQCVGIALMICGAAIGVTAVFLRAKKNKHRCV